jgi:hypothetical protein
MRALLVALFLSVASTASAQTPTLPTCADNGADHDRWAIKNRRGPAAMNASDETEIDVNEMVSWRVPANIPSDQRDSDQPITQREKDRKLYALVGFVRLIKLETDCDMHVQVAQSAASGSPQVIVEVPRRFTAVQRELMALTGMKSGSKSKRWIKDAPPRLRFVGLAFLDQPHQTDPPTKEGHGHGPGGVVRTLWELHPVLKVEAAAR